MTVKELTQLLSKIPPEVEVVMEIGGGYYSLTPFELSTHHVRVKNGKRATYVKAKASDDCLHKTVFVINP